MDKERERLEAAFNKAVDDLKATEEGDPAAILLVKRINVAWKRLSDYLRKQDDN